MPVDENNVPLGIHKKWGGNLAAQCWLWKDHTGYDEAVRIAQLARWWLANGGGELRLALDARLINILDRLELI